MKKTYCLVTVLFVFTVASFAQENKETHKVNVPNAVKAALAKKYPGISKVAWEKENRNFEANWGGKSGEDSSVQFTPSGEFIEMVKAIPVSQLPGPVIIYVKKHYKGSGVTEAGRVTDAHGKITYEAEVNGKDIIFDERGGFIKAEN